VTKFHLPSSFFCRFPPTRSLLKATCDPPPPCVPSLRVSHSLVRCFSFTGTALWPFLYLFHVPVQLSRLSCLRNSAVCFRFCNWLALSSVQKFSSWRGSLRDHILQPPLLQIPFPYPCVPLRSVSVTVSLRLRFRYSTDSISEILRPHQLFGFRLLLLPV